MKNRVAVDLIDNISGYDKVSLTIKLLSDSHLPEKVCLFASMKAFKIKMMKNAFYFILKALFVLSIFNFSF